MNAFSASPLLENAKRIHTRAPASFSTNQILDQRPESLSQFEVSAIFDVRSLDDYPPTIQLIMLDIALTLLVATVAHYAASAIGMDSLEAIATGIIIGGVAGVLSLLQKPVAKVAVIGAVLGACGSIAVQLLAAQQGAGIQLEYVLLFASLAGLLGILSFGFGTVTIFVIRRARQ